ncbi:MAG: putative acyl-CoA dehydrogenase [Candidatus Bathyarchaeota archaeon BA2]|nr:MAG: putative acyl-CoA dehydrogenase [Candidatus Bathyarchaeota archaeon BA2]
MLTIDDFPVPKLYLAPMDAQIRGLVREVVDKKIIPNRKRYDEDWFEHKLIEPVMKELMVDVGFQKAIFPLELGGLGYNSLEYRPCAGMNGVLEEIARGDSGVAVAVGVTLWPYTMCALEPAPIRDDLLKEFAPIYCDTEEPRFSALCMTEPQGGSDIENMDIMHGKTIKTTAKLEKDEWVINGHKLWPTNTGGLPGMHAVVCTTKLGSTDEKDFAIIWVPTDAKGVRHGDPYLKAGMAADKNSDVWYEDVRVPKRYRMHGPGLDAKYFRIAISWGCMGSSAFCVGILINICEILDRYFSDKIFQGRPLKEQDAVAAVLSELVSDAQIMRWAVYEYSHMIDRPDLYGYSWDPEIVAKGRALKIFATNTLVKDTEKAVDLMGKYGCDRDWDVEKQWRDGKIIQLWMGGLQLCQMETARWFYKCETL